MGRMWKQYSATVKEAFKELVITSSFFSNIIEHQVCARH